MNVHDAMDLESLSKNQNRDAEYTDEVANFIISHLEETLGYIFRNKSSSHRQELVGDTEGTASDEENENREGEHSR